MGETGCQGPLFCTLDFAEKTINSFASYSIVFLCLNKIKSLVSRPHIDKVQQSGSKKKLGTLEHVNNPLYVTRQNLFFLNFIPKRGGK